MTTTQSEKNQIAAELARADGLNAKLQDETKRNAVLLAQAQGELDKMNSQKSNTLADLAMEKRNVDELSSRLKAQTESLDREKELLTAGRDITDLMGARSLHVVDVYDGDGTGKNKKSFGRVFYTEGKSLVFMLSISTSAKSSTRNTRTRPGASGRRILLRSKVWEFCM